MVQGYTQKLKELLRQHGCEYVRSGKGDRGLEESPLRSSDMVDGKIMSRHTANAILKQAGIKARF